MTFKQKVNGNKERENGRKEKKKNMMVLAERLFFIYFRKYVLNIFVLSYKSQF